MAKRLPTEFAINMCLEKMMILQQSELKEVGSFNYFDEINPCHIYFIGKRPRITISIDEFEVTIDKLKFPFKIHYQNELIDFPLILDNGFGDTDIRLEAKYPYSSFQLYSNDKQVFNAKTSVFIQTYSYYPLKTGFLDFEVLYIGQSYGVEGSRTAPDRLVKHSTLQGIYAEAITNNPDSEIWLALASFEQINLMMMDGRTKFSEEEIENDKERFQSVFYKLNYEGINEQQKINFTEAALIRYFQPSYNIIYKDSFPNPAHSTYSECYDLDIHSICIELNTSEMVKCKFYSDKVEKNPWHIKEFELHSREERIGMFDIKN